MLVSYSSCCGFRCVVADTDVVDGAASVSYSCVLLHVFLFALVVLPESGKHFLMLAALSHARHVCTLFTLDSLWPRCLSTMFVSLLC